ncbi:MAG TPA: ABC transporter ATP-binding protein [Chloroflexota bacterium]|nr:ABC transporter ATP-binding protein [Chloroflexota bacterium]
MSTLIELHNVTKVFGSGPNATVALDNLSLSISDDTPSFTAVAGESGSGKTTLARILLGFTPPTSGQVLYRGKDLWKISDAERRQFRKEVQAIFQDPFEVFNPFYRVDHLLNVPIEKFRLATSRQHARRLIEEALAAVGLRPEDTLGRFPHQLSGGQRQRLTIARALILRPRLIIADEPVSMVDASLRATILESLRTLNQEFGISFLYITHDLTTAYQISENILVLFRGGVAEVGDVDLVIKQPEHPYSQLLVSSIPQPDVDRRWGGDQEVQVESGSGTKTGCRFADRCPRVMPMCLENPPPLYRTAPGRAVACFLHRDAPVLPGEQMNEVLAKEVVAK